MADGKFSDANRAPVVTAINEKVLGGGLRRLFRSVGSVVIMPVDDSGPHASVEASLSCSGLVNRLPKVAFSASGTSARDLVRRLVAAHLDDPEPRASSGHAVYEFAADVTADELVDFAMRGLRVLGAHPADGRWTYTEIDEAQV